MRQLHDMLGESEAGLREQWARAMGHEPDGAEHTEADESFSRFLTGLRSALRPGVAEAGPLPPAEPTPEGPLAPSVDAPRATRAFGLLHERILEIAAEHGVEVTSAENRILVSHVGAAIGEVMAAQVRGHERDRHRLAHQLRNPLGSAMMALTLLRTKDDAADRARLADLAERNLEKLRGLIDASVETTSSYRGDRPVTP